MISTFSKLQFTFVGKKRLRHYEQICLDAWRDSLGEGDRAILDSQLSATNLIQRQAGDAKVCFFYPKEQTKIPLFANQQPDLHVADVDLVSNGSENARMRAKIFVHRGRFFSIEFPKRPDRYMQLHGMSKEQLHVSDVASLRNP
jgi:hypothetical protein